MRDVRRLAHIHLPQQWEPEEIVREVKKLGFTDLYFFVNKTEAGTDLGGLRFPLAMEVGRLAELEGLGVMVNTGYMKYHEQIVLAHPERRMILRRDPATSGNGGRMSELSWFCPFNEANKDWYKEELRELARIPALRYVYLNDEGFLGAKGEIACYCDFCRKRFSEHFGEEPPAEINWKSPLWRKWIKWRFEEWTALHAEFREVVRAICPKVGVGMATAGTELMGLRPWASAVDVGAMSRALDSMNTGIYHGVPSGAHTYIPRFVVVLDVVSVFKGALQEKPLRLAVQAFCPGTSLELTRKDGHWIGILPYAVGAEFVSPWCFETLKTLPAQYEAYKETFRLDPYLRETEPEVACSLLHSIQSEVWRYPDQDYDALSVRLWSQILRDEGLPYAYVWDSRLGETNLKRWGPLVLPHVCCLSEAQKDRLTSYLEEGGGILANSDLGLYDEEGGPSEAGLSSRWGVTLSGKVLEGQYRLRFADACPIREDITAPVIVDAPYEVTASTGEVWATLVDTEGRDAGIPALVYSRVGNGKFVYLAGAPVPQHKEPGFEPSVQRPNHTRRLVQKLVRFLSVRSPSIEVEDFPPVTAYQRLRPWDRRGINTFQFLPQVGPRFAMAIIASYLGEEADLPIRFRVPGGKRPVRVFNGLTEESYMDRAQVDGDTVRLTVRVTYQDAVIPVVVEWSAS